MGDAKTPWDSGATLAERFRAHAGKSTHLYAVTMRAMADDWEAGGPVRVVCAGYEDAPTGSAIQLRLLAAVFRIVLSGRAPELVRFYPCLGGGDPPEQAWPVLREVIAAHVGEIHDALVYAPQTNEVGRSAALLAGLFDLVAASGSRRVRLLELGASAGLNLLVDRYGYAGDGWRHGPADSPLELVDAITGPVRPQDFSVASARGCDLEPVDVATPAGRQWLTSFVWPFHVHRHERLAAALAVAAAHPPTVDRAGAADWLSGQLGSPSDPDTLSVVWNSITELYWPGDEVSRVADLLQDHGASHRLGRVSMEYDSSDPSAEPDLRTTLWDPTHHREPRRRLLGRVQHHGIPVRLAG